MLIRLAIERAHACTSPLGECLLIAVAAVHGNGNSSNDINHDTVSCAYIHEKVKVPIHRRSLYDTSYDFISSRRMGR